MDRTTNRKVGKYEVIGKVAQGGMGALYKARHPTLNRIVLLKRLDLRGVGGAVERFRREARLMMDFKNDHIVQVHDHFKEGSHYYIVEEYVDGISLDELIRRERYLTADAAALILYEVAKALQYAHERGVIHRDIKPGNILISRQGDVKLADFGIATSREEPDQGLTRDGTMLGTIAYTAPEQIDDARSVDPRSDIYSLGIVLYEMLTGRTPYPGTFTGETIRRIHRGRYAPVRRVNPRASRFLARIARRCMRPKRSRRYASLSRIVRILERRIRPHDPATIRQAMRKIVEGGTIKGLVRRRRSWLARLATAVVVIGLAGAAGWYAWDQGWWYEYAAPDRFGALVITAQVERSGKPAESIYLEPVLYRSPPGRLERLDDVEFGIHENPALATDRSFVLESDRLYLPAGRYRLKVSLENELAWYSFDLEPRSVQRKLLSTLEGLRISVSHAAGTRVPLAVRCSAYDADSGREITSEATVLVLRTGGWRSLADGGAEGLTSGWTWRFRVTCPGYRSEDFDLIVQPWQTSLRLDARLGRLAQGSTGKTDD
jgi:tRNA A-37 threonylcarbamoyl transferase component Bud32